jgi:hypothetical protein
MKERQKKPQSYRSNTSGTNFSVKRYAATPKSANEVILLIFYECSFSKE